MSGNEVIGYNPNISKEDAKKYLNDNVIFIDDLKIDYEVKEGYKVKITLDNENVPHYEYIEIKEEQPSQLDRIENALKESKTEMIETAIDEYTMELIEQGVL